jgi:hypothetical protein
MASAAPVSVSTTAVSLHASNGTRRTVAIYNSGSNTVYMGGSDVTSSTGYPLAAYDDIVMQLGENEVVYGICATSESASLRVFGAGA